MNANIKKALLNLLRVLHDEDSNLINEPINVSVVTKVSPRLYISHIAISQNCVGVFRHDNVDDNLILSDDLYDGELS